MAQGGQGGLGGGSVPGGNGGIGGMPRMPLGGGSGGQGTVPGGRMMGGGGQQNQMFRPPGMPSGAFAGGSPGFREGYFGPGAQDAPQQSMDQRGGGQQPDQLQALWQQQFGGSFPSMFPQMSPGNGQQQYSGMGPTQYPTPQNVGSAGGGANPYQYQNQGGAYQP